jgi:hypothetical protein
MWVFPLILTTLVASCRQTFTDPGSVHYLAIIPVVQSSVEGQAGQQLTFRVSATDLGIDTIIAVAPQDTILMKTLAGNYTVELTEGVPVNCIIRGAKARKVGIDELTNTALVRYAIQCKPMLMVITDTRGLFPDSAYVYALEDTNGIVETGSLAAADTAYPVNLSPGGYTVHLHNAASHCTFLNDGGSIRRVEARPGGGAIARFELRCSDDERSPTIVSVKTSHAEGAVGVYFSAYDANRDIGRYWLDVTDCRANSVLSAGGRVMDGLRFGRTARADAIEVIAAIETGLTSEELRGRCVGLRVEDQAGNTTPLLQHRFETSTGDKPVVSNFDAVLLGTTTIRINLEATDSDEDLVGSFVIAKLRDGTIGVVDGTPDFLPYNTVGYLGTVVPDAPLAPRFTFGDVLSVIVYLVDRNGNFTRVEDAKLLQ